MNQVTGLQLQVELARGHATRAEMPLVAICRGGHRGCVVTRIPCKDCYKIAADDSRSSAEILRDMERGDG